VDNNVQSFCAQFGTTIKSRLRPHDTLCVGAGCSWILGVNTGVSFPLVIAYSAVHTWIVGTSPMTPGWNAVRRRGVRT
jgi:hypothetical protein